MDIPHHSSVLASAILLIIMLGSPSTQGLQPVMGARDQLALSSDYNSAFPVPSRSWYDTAGCPIWLTDYIRFHKEKKHQPDAKYMVYSCHDRQCHFGEWIFDGCAILINICVKVSHLYQSISNCTHRLQLLCQKQSQILKTATASRANIGLQIQSQDIYVGLPRLHLCRRSGQGRSNHQCHCSFQCC